MSDIHQKPSVINMIYVGPLFFIICYLCANTHALGPYGEVRCVTMVQADAESYEYRIPDDNPVLKGIDKATTGWYRRVEWKQNVTAGLKLTYVRDERKYNGNNYWWWNRANGTVNLCDMRLRDEGGSWAHFVREALGLANGCPRPAGEVKTDGGLFSGGRCRTFTLDTDDKWRSNEKHRLFLDVVDGGGNKLLTGVGDLF
ncbi:uncharacterized protein LOC107048242 [Diachasma alloeum]|uniref:uncharacterized protein LOC107048242 n=1 Tax=Diachasma alloeum TaxID=454923 RepID=UPI00073825BC|nr:uncharacterized protein LOC107048242 [Diachasma alloeum]